MASNTTNPASGTHGAICMRVFRNGANRGAGNEVIAGFQRYSTQRPVERCVLFVLS
jgi:hypothetical protein